MSRQLDLQIYLALNGYTLKEIPEDRFEAYMSEPHYTTDAEAMLMLDKEMRERGWGLLIRNDINYHANYFKISGGNKAISHTEPLARALAAYKALTGKEWEGANAG